MSGSFTGACCVLQAPAGYSCVYIRAPTVPASSTVSISVLAASSDHPPGLWTAGSFCKEIAPTEYNWSWVGVSWWFYIISIHWSWCSNSVVQLSNVILQANTLFMYFITNPICMTYQNSSERYTVDDFMTFELKKNNTIWRYNVSVLYWKKYIGVPIDCMSYVNWHFRLLNPCPCPMCDYYPTSKIPLTLYCT